MSKNKKDALVIFISPFTKVIVNRSVDIQSIRISWWYSRCQYFTDHDQYSYNNDCVQRFIVDNDNLIRFHVSFCFKSIIISVHHFSISIGHSLIWKNKTERSGFIYFSDRLLIWKDFTFSKVFARHILCISSKFTVFIFVKMYDGIMFLLNIFCLAHRTKYISTTLHFVKLVRSFFM